jgi:hypothetical protein
MTTVVVVVMELEILVLMMVSSYGVSNNARFSGGYSEEDRKEMIQWAREMREAMHLFRSAVMHRVESSTQVDLNVDG